MAYAAQPQQSTCRNTGERTCQMNHSSETPRTEEAPRELDTRDRVVPEHSGGHPNEEMRNAYLRAVSYRADR